MRAVLAGGHAAQGIGWVTTYASVQELEEARAALAGHADWLELLDTKADGLYAEVPELTAQRVYRRIA